MFIVKVAIQNHLHKMHLPLTAPHMHGMTAGAPACGACGACGA
jgi:hypothetical protein